MIDKFLRDLANALNSIADNREDMEEVSKILSSHTHTLRTLVDSANKTNERIAELESKLSIIQFQLDKL